LSLRTFHSSQVAIRVASVKKGMLWAPRAWVYLSSRGSDVSQLICIVTQHSFANVHSKNRWSMVSSSPLSHMTHISVPWTSRCLLRSIVLVLRRSTRTNQAKNLTRGVHLDFQMILKIGCVSTKHDVLITSM